MGDIYTEVTPSKTGLSLHKRDIQDSARSTIIWIEWICVQFQMSCERREARLSEDADPSSTGVSGNAGVDAWCGSHMEAIGP